MNPFRNQAEKDIYPIEDESFEDKIYIVRHETKMSRQRFRSVLVSFSCFLGLVLCILTFMSFLSVLTSFFLFIFFFSGVVYVVANHKEMDTNAISLAELKEKVKLKS